MVGWEEGVDEGNITLTLKEAVLLTLTYCLIIDIREESLDIIKEFRRGGGTPI